VKIKGQEWNLGSHEIKTKQRTAQKNTLRTLKKLIQNRTKPFEYFKSGALIGKVEPQITSHG